MNFLKPLKMSEKMKTNSKINTVFPWIMAVAGFLIAFLFFKKDNIDPPKVIEYKDSIVYVPVIDTVFLTNTIYEIERDPYLIRDTVVDTFVQYIADNVSKELLAEIARNHYNINLYIDSIQIDSLGYVVITDSLQANRIKQRIVTYDLAFTQPDLRKAFLSAGVSVGGNKQSFDFGVGLMFTTKNKWSVGYDYYGMGKTHMLTVKKSLFEFK